MPARSGFTLVELAIVILLLGLLSMVGINEWRRLREQALVASCLSFHIALNRSLWGEYAKTGDFPNSLEGVIDNMDAWALQVEYKYVGGEDDDAGHGNDWDSDDADNPGNSGDGTVDNAGFYMRCGHNHSYVDVLFVDSGAYLPPKAIRDEEDARGDPIKK